MNKTDLLREMFTQELNPDERDSLTSALQTAIKDLINRDKSIFLEGFGILSSQIEKSAAISSIDQHTIRRVTKVRHITFQKCNELTSFLREANPAIIEEREFAETVYSKLKLDLQLKWHLSLMRKYIRGFIELLKHEVITQGYSQRLKQIGDFYALHNRQGSLFSDWYAGANVIIKSNCDTEISCEECKSYLKPVVSDAWELPGCLYGSPLHIFSIKLPKELKRLGFDVDHSLFTEPSDSQVQIAIFARKVGAQQQLIYCTDGLRKLALNTKAGNALGNELVFQIAYDSDFRESGKNSTFKLDDLILPDWPKTVFVMGWIMLQSTRQKNLKIGSGLSLNTPLCQDIPQSRLSSIIATGFQVAQSEQESEDGSFKYINLVGICEDEYKLAESYSANHLLTLLRFKRMDQVTKLCRPSLLSKTSFLDLNSLASQAPQPAMLNEQDSHSLPA